MRARLSTCSPALLFQTHRHAHTHNTSHALISSCPERVPQPSLVVGEETEEERFPLSPPVTRVALARLPLLRVSPRTTHLVRACHAAAGPNKQQQQQQLNARRAVSPLEPRRQSPTMAAFSQIIHDTMRELYAGRADEPEAITDLRVLRDK